MSQNQAKCDADGVKMHILKPLDSLQALGAETHPTHNHLHLRSSCSMAQVLMSMVNAPARLQRLIFPPLLSRGRDDDGLG